MSIFESEETFRLMINRFEEQNQYLIGLLDKAYMESARGDAIQNFAVLLDGLTDYATAHFYLIEHIVSNLYSMEHRVRQVERFTDPILMEVNVSKLREEYDLYISLLGEVKNQFYSSSKLVPLSLLSSLTNWLTHDKFRITATWQAHISPCSQ